MLAAGIWIVHLAVLPCQLCQQSSKKRSLVGSKSKGTPFVEAVDEGGPVAFELAYFFFFSRKAFTAAERTLQRFGHSL